VALYQPQGEYRFTKGFSLVALVALVVAILPSLPGFLVQVKLVKTESIPPALADMYHYAWFVGFLVAFAVYLAGRKIAAFQRC
jgi:NCS1 family nucleobase:cation symporter-1